MLLWKLTFCVSLIVWMVVLSAMIGISAALRHRGQGHGLIVGALKVKLKLGLVTLGGPSPSLSLSRAAGPVFALYAAASSAAKSTKSKGVKSTAAVAGPKSSEKETVLVIVESPAKVSYGTLPVPGYMYMLFANQLF